MAGSGKALLLLQWNCRGRRANGAELNELLRALDRKPLVVLLQETKRKGPGIQGYHSFEVPTAGMCNDVQEVVAVRVFFGRRTLLVASTYVRPQLPGANFDWMRQLRALYPRDEVVIGGDFNALSTSWGYRVTNIRVRNLEESAEYDDLILVNDLSCPTRLGQSPSERGTIPNLTWATPFMVSLWKCDSSSWGSSHYSIWITLSSTSRKINKKDTPAPARHLINLWNVHDDL
ncbi:hypothetical protein HPB48_015921 [Haemaphysalis longicornis]|uniref:Endonuclease/exonuclease/phosphatase domain-containing protein n=1 Tax=Haemaphysalis longicornis TaxID=44386 RepID=A0A9J6GXM8_HAELO|nr:hypothetical protein HPB48_015921 [Haemaphysalis longicornis]